MEGKGPKDPNDLVSGWTGFVPKIEVKQPGKIVFYPVTHNELHIIKNANYGNIACSTFWGALSAFVSFITAYSTCPFETERKELVFLFVSIACAITSFVSLLFWLYLRQKSNKLYEEIVNREDAAILK